MATKTYKEEERYLIDDIKNNWFKDHHAKLMVEGELLILDWKKLDTVIYSVRYISDHNHIILDWKKLDTVIYSVRYIFDHNHMYVSGDLGEAVFRFTEKAVPARIAGYNIGYFCEKLRAFSGPLLEFNQTRAGEELDEMVKQWREEEYDYGIDAVIELRQIIRDSTSVEQFHIAIANFDRSKMGNDCWEWLPSLGSVTPIRLRAYLIGLQMAVEESIWPGKG